jgi:hypothetical protein
MAISLDYSNFVILIDNILRSDQNSSFSTSFTLGNNASACFKTSIKQINDGVIFDNNSLVRVYLNLELSIPTYIVNSNNDYNIFITNINTVFTNLQESDKSIEYKTSIDQNYYYISISYSSKAISKNEIIQNGDNYGKGIILDIGLLLLTTINYINLYA